ncbi:MAG: hypothetical protein L6R35_004083 [Caloplaca aegaea]|nr:MAG: hypothetical protein L6R35_004083 [Caloplaca aegaea]
MTKYFWNANQIDDFNRIASDSEVNVHKQELGTKIIFDHEELLIGGYDSKGGLHTGISHTKDDPAQVSWKSYK